MKRIISLFLLLFLAGMLMGCSNAADNAFFTEETIIADDEIFDSIKDEIGEIDDSIIHEEETDFENDPKEEEPSPNIEKEEDPEEESTPPKLNPIDDVWMPQITAPDINIGMDTEKIDNLLSLYESFINKDYRASIMIDIINPNEPYLVNDETIEYTNSKINEYGIGDLGFSYKWFTTTVYINEPFVSFDQFVALFTLAQKEDVKVNVLIYLG